MGISVILNAAIALVGPFFPPEAEKKGVDLKIIGYIFSAYPMAFVCISLVMPTILHYTNPRAVFIISSIIYACSVAGFGSIVFMDKNLLIILGLVFRVLQGSSNAALYTTTYSIFSLQYEGKDFMMINSLFKGTIGGGLLLGLCIGTVLYIIGGYFLPFVVYSSVMLLCVPFVARYIPVNPLEDKDFILQTEKCSDDDIEMSKKDQNITDKNNNGNENAEAQAPPTIKTKRKINPFKLVWRLFKNKVRFEYSIRLELILFHLICLN